MKNDFISIFKAIEPAEQQRFHQYIHFFHGQHKIVLSVFDEVVQAIAANGEEAFSASVSKNKKMQNDLSDLKKWLLTFLTIQEAQTNSVDAQFLTLEALRKRKLMSAFSQKAKHIDKILREHPSPDMWLMLRKLRLAHINYFDLEIDPLQNYQNQLIQILNQLDSFYISAKLKYTAERQSRTRVLHEIYPSRFLDDQLLRFASEPHLEPAVNNFYLPFFDLVNNSSETAYQTLRTFLMQNEKHESIERLSVLLSLLNFAASRMRKGDVVYQNEYFELHEIGMSQSLLIATGYISTEVFTNAVNLACFFKKHDWAEIFIQEWSEHLEPDAQEVAVNLVWARIHFDRKEYDEAMSLLLKITSYKNMSINVQARLLLVRTYYELQRPEKMQMDGCNNLTQYANRTKEIGEDMKTGILHFTKILRPLIQKKNKDQLLKELNSLEQPILCYDWLIAKINDLSSVE